MFSLITESAIDKACQIPTANGDDWLIIVFLYIPRSIALAQRMLALFSGTRGLGRKV